MALSSNVAPVSLLSSRWGTSTSSFLYMTASTASVPELSLPWATPSSISTVHESTTKLTTSHSKEATSKPQDEYLSSFWTSGTSKPETWSEEERSLRRIPSYVLEYAPLIHLYSQEQLWPCDIAEHLLHTTPFLNYTPLSTTAQRQNLSDLDALNAYRPFVFLTSDDNVEDRPAWLGNKSNVPEHFEVREESFAKQGGNGQNILDGSETMHDSMVHPRRRTSGRPARATQSERSSPEEQSYDGPDFQAPMRSQNGQGGRSNAPAILVVVDKGGGIVDAFWFFFYSYNLGNKVLNVRFGNHIGDWEHTLVRFKHGEPLEVFFSEHYTGEAYSYNAVEKIGKRPVGFSASGTHAMYATAGTHRYVLPGGLLHDMTDRGPLWDPLLNSHSYTFNPKTDTIRSSNVTPKAPIEWFKFAGHWGDKRYKLRDSRQYFFAGQWHYVTGPLGPRYKSLGRRNVCPGRGKCIIKHWRTERSLPRPWVGEEDGKDWDDFDIESLH